MNQFREHSQAHQPVEVLGKYVGQWVMEKEILPLSSGEMLDQNIA